jgi:predicted Zn-dependent protease
MTQTSEPQTLMWSRAQMYFDAKDYAGAARVLADLLEQVPEQLSVRMLLARSYYHSAQLRRAEEQLRRIVDREPVEAYAQLLLGRTLQRQNRAEEAAAHLRLAGALDPELTAARSSG